MNQKEFSESIKVGMQLYNVEVSREIDSSKETFTEKPVIVMKKNNNSIYTCDKDDMEGYRSRYILKGHSHFPILKEDRFDGWLGADFLTNDPNMATRLRKNHEESIDLDNRLDQLFHKVKDSSNVVKKEILVKMSNLV